jgi:acyl-CoA reductase-like NAD-dependent aldehyde dehydrogenase
MTLIEPAHVDLDVDALTGRLAVGAQAWAGCGLAERRALLVELSARVTEQAEEWVRVAAQIKGLTPGSPMVGEEWLSGPYAVLAFARALRETLHRLEEGRDVLGSCAVTEAPDGRVAVRVLPYDAFDKVLLSGYRAEVWTRPGPTEAGVRAEAGRRLVGTGQTEGVALVLGAGNVFSIPPLDVLHQLYAEHRTVVLKLNPTTNALADTLRAVFKPFADRNLVEVVTGGPQMGAALAEHPAVTAVHLTGSAVTHDAIVWGTGAEGDAARAAGKPRLGKPISSELGGVSPVIVVPGRWSAADLEFQAQHVATQRLHNIGSNCVATQVVVLSADWSQRTQFVSALRRALAAAPRRPAWYPGSADRVAEARTRHPDAVAVGGTAERTVLTGLDPGDDRESAFSSEYFAPVLGITELAGGPAEFLDAAVTFANDRLVGTLGATIVVHPRTRRGLGDRFERAIADLHYGTVGINAWTGVGYLTARASWGAFPGHRLEDVGSGIGVVHNALQLEGVERTVVTGPFRPFPRSVLHGERALSPKPPWFVSNCTAARTAERLTRFAARPRWRAIPGIVLSALRG